MALTTQHEEFKASSVQQGGFIVIYDEKTNMWIKIDPLLLREILYAHTDEEYFQMIDESEQPYSERSQQLAKELRAKALKNLGREDEIERL